jgi:putative spermidine/putrescine transport system substrate-binding protein
MAKQTRRTTLLQGAGLAAAASTLGFPSIVRAAETLIVNSYGGSFEEFMRKQIIPPFEKETGVEIQLDVGLGKGWLANLRAAGPDNPPYDVLMTNEAWASIERSEGFFEPIPVAKVPNMKDLHPIARLPDDNGVIAILSPIGLAYRTDMIDIAPTSWTDLWNNQDYRGQIGMYTITNSAGYMFVMMTAQIYGGSQYKTDVALDKIKELLPFPQVDFSGTMETMLTRGEVAIGPLDSAAVARLKLGGAPLEWAAPKEGVFMFEQVFCMLKGSKKKEAGYKWIDYQLRPDTQQKWVEGYYYSPTNLKTKVPEKLQPLVPIRGKRLDEVILWDWKTANENRDKVIEEWNKQMR